MMLVSYLLLLIFSLIKRSTEFEFIGKNNWSDDFFEQCDNLEIDKSWQRNDMICIQYVHKLQPVNLEILSWSPALVIYRDFLSKTQVSNFMNTIHQTQLKEQRVLDRDSLKSNPSEVRQANGSFIKHYADPATTDVFDTTRRLIPGMEFTTAEEFSALSYHPGGHYAPHHDYISFDKKEDYDWWTINRGPRAATFIVVYQTAKKGGATVFPTIRRTVRANSGDAFLWFNSKADTTKEELTKHGGCPVYEGEKIISTLWLRSKGQSILSMANNDHPIGAEWLIPGLVDKTRSNINNQCF